MRLFRYLAIILLAIACNSFSFSLHAQDKQTKQDGSSALDLLGGLFGSLVEAPAISIDKLAGTWTYVSPAISFKSDDLLQNIGGAAASSSLEQNIAPYYQKAGLDKLVIVINPNATVTLTIPAGTTTGTVSVKENGDLNFQFNALQAFNGGNIKAKAQFVDNNLSLTFDVSDIKDIVDKLAQLSNDQTLNSLSALMSNYKGIYAGFKLKKSN